MSEKDRLMQRRDAFDNETAGEDRQMDEWEDARMEG